MRVLACTPTQTTLNCIAAAPLPASAPAVTRWQLSTAHRRNGLALLQARRRSCCEQRPGHFVHATFQLGALMASSLNTLANYDATWWLPCGVSTGPCSVNAVQHPPPRPSRLRYSTALKAAALHKWLDATTVATTTIPANRYLLRYEAENHSRPDLIQACSETAWQAKMAIAAYSQFPRLQSASHQHRATGLPCRHWRYWGQQVGAPYGRPSSPTAPSVTDIAQPGALAQE